MDFLCPNCQKMLTVPDQYAGTLMKCPLCANTFQAPALPSRAPAPAVVAPPPSAAAPPGNTYGLKEPPPVPPMAPPPVSNKVSASPPKAPAPAKAPPPLPPSTGDYQHSRSLSLDPKVLQYVPIVALVLVFLIQTFFPMVGMYPGGYPAHTQGVWYGIWGYYSTNPDWDKMPAANEKVPALILDKNGSAGISAPMLFYFFPIFPLALLLTAAAVALGLPNLRLKLPDIVDKIKGYRWAIAAGLTLLAFLLLSINVFFGFSLETKVKSDIATSDWMKTQRNRASEGDKLVAMAEGSLLGAQCLERTLWLRLSYFLLLLAVAVSGLLAWIDWRGPRPLPQLEFRH
jgi:hypothetical protein